MNSSEIKCNKYGITWLKSILILGVLLLAFFLAELLKPNNLGHFGKQITSLETMIPKVIPGWKMIDLNIVSLVSPQQEKTLNKVYSKILSRTYENKEGYKIMLSISYGTKQTSDLAVHYPEVCYPAQGFNLLSDEEEWLNLGSRDIPIKRLRTVLNNTRFEPVTYWTTIGEYTTVNALEKRVIELMYGLQGFVVDGLLFRVSSIDKSFEKGFIKQEDFIKSMVSALNKEDREKIIGTKLLVDVNY